MTKLYWYKLEVCHIFFIWADEITGPQLFSYGLLRASVSLLPFQLKFYSYRNLTQSINYFFQSMRLPLHIPQRIEFHFQWRKNKSKDNYSVLNVFEYEQIIASKQRLHINNEQGNSFLFQKFATRSHNEKKSK